MKSLFTPSFIFKTTLAGIALACLIIFWLPDNAGDQDADQQAQSNIVQIKHTNSPNNDIEDQPNHKIIGTNAPFSYASAVDTAAPSVVNIYTARRVQVQDRTFRDPLLEQFFGGRRNNQGRIQTGSGSGVIIDQAGYVLTNYHVIQKAEQARVMLADGRDFPAQFIGADPETDLAVLKIEAKDLNAITFDSSDEIYVGDVVLAIGNPFGVGQTVTMGIVSATGRDRLGLNTFENFIQTDAAINPGNSGGALVNARGELVGINTAIFSQSGGSEGIGFAIPASMALDVLTQIIEKGKVVRGWLGISGRDLPAKLRKSKNINGVFIASVFRNGPAHKAGIQAGDIITELNGQTVTNTRNILKIVTQLQPGATLRIKGIRNGEKFDTRATLIERPSNINS